MGSLGWLRRSYVCYQAKLLLLTAPSVQCMRRGGIYIELINHHDLTTPRGGHHVHMITMVTPCDQQSTCWQHVHPFNLITSRCKQPLQAFVCFLSIKRRQTNLWHEPPSFLQILTPRTSHFPARKCSTLQKVDFICLKIGWFQRSIGTGHPLLLPMFWANHNPVCVTL